MTFITGVCGIAPEAPRGSVDPMIAAQQALAPDGVRIQEAQNATFARGLYRLVEEDASDEQPYLSADGQRLFVADSRIDNRGELLDRLGLNAGSHISDSEIVFLGFERFGEGIVELLLGDFAFAAYDNISRQLMLARDYSGQRPLNYHLGDGFVAFASMPHGLLAHESVSPDPDKKQWAEFFADIPRSGPRTYFEAIKRVEPGHVVKIGPNGLTSRAYWTVPGRRTDFNDHQDYALALREHLERAVKARVRGSGEVIGAHLSAGLDSGAVATTTALILKPEGKKVLAFTGAPRLGFDGPLPRGRALGDESGIAGRAAAMHANMEHVVVRAEGRSPIEVARRDSVIFGEPLGLPCNQVWWSAVVEAAHERGIRTLLTGESGNHAFSSGGLPTLAEFVGDGKWGLFLKEARNLHRRGTKWQGIGGSAFGPWIPPKLWAALQRWKWGRPLSREGASLLTAGTRALLPQGPEAISRDSPPARHARQARAVFLQHVDPGVFRKGTLARWGVEEVDPTTDRRLVEYCFALPPEQLLRNGVTRALARTAFSDRLPPEMVHGPRGYQGADWYERVDRAAVCQALTELGHQISSNEVLDLNAVESLASTWPTSGWETGSVISSYRYAVLRALSAGYFLASFNRLEASRSLRGQQPAITGAL